MEVIYIVYVPLAFKRLASGTDYNDDGGGGGVVVVVMMMTIMMMMMMMMMMMIMMMMMMMLMMMVMMTMMIQPVSFLVKHFWPCSFPVWLGTLPRLAILKFTLNKFSLMLSYVNVKYWR